MAISTGTLLATVATSTLLASATLGATQQTAGPIAERLDDLIRLRVAGAEIPGPSMEANAPAPVLTRRSLTPLPEFRRVFDPDDVATMALVDRPGNSADTNGLGAVPVAFRMAFHEVTNTEFVEFLNAVAVSDPGGLYADIMTDSDRGGILRSGSDGSFNYSIKANFENKPANGFCWLDAARYCNWLHNGRPIGPQGPSTTEKGAYDLSVPPDMITRQPGALFFIPTHDEWYKAAYFDPSDPGADANGTTDYWLYPTRSDAVPTKALADAFGDVTNPGPNVGNLDRGADWNDENGNVTSAGGAGSTSPWGIFDLAGNINELTETPGTTIPPNPPSQPDPLPTRRIRGGDFANVEILAGSPAFLAGSLNMQAEAANMGLRIAAPAAMGVVWEGARGKRPLLTAEGRVAAGSSIVLRLEGGPARARGVLALSDRKPRGRRTQPGHPAPDRLLLPAWTDGAGALVRGIQLPERAAAGTRFYFQVVLALPNDNGRLYSNLLWIELP